MITPDALAEFLTYASFEDMLEEQLDPYTKLYVSTTFERMDLMIRAVRYQSVFHYVFVQPEFLLVWLALEGMRERLLPATVTA
jgi:hypothetical protein